MDLMLSLLYSATSRARRASPVLLALLVWLPACVPATSVLRPFLFPTYYLSDLSEPAPMEGRERIWIDIPEGRVEAWFIPAEGVTAERPGPVVVVLHGNAGFIDDLPYYFSEYQRMGISLFLPEYRGYGRSDGEPSEASITADLVHFYDLLVQRPDVDPTRIVFHDFSLGGATACSLASYRRPAALILESTFTSFRELVADFFIPSMAVFDPFENLQVVAESSTSWPIWGAGSSRCRAASPPCARTGIRSRGRSQRAA